MTEGKKRLLFKEVRYWSLLLIGCVALSFTPWLVRLAVNGTLSKEQRETIQRYEEELRRQGISQ